MVDDAKIQLSRLVFPLWSGQWDPFPRNSSREDPTDVGRQDRANEAQGKFERKILQPMLLLILNGEKSDKSSWHNNACNDLAGKFSKCCSEFIILEDKKSWKERIFFWNVRFYLWKSQARGGDCKAVRLILSQRALADYFPVLKWVFTNVLISGNFVLFTLLGGE